MDVSALFKHFSGPDKSNLTTSSVTSGTLLSLTGPQCPIVTSVVLFLTFEGPRWTGSSCQISLMTDFSTVPVKDSVLAWRVGGREKYDFNIFIDKFGEARVHLGSRLILPCGH